MLAASVSKIRAEIVGYNQPYPTHAVVNNCNIPSTSFIETKSVNVVHLPPKSPIPLTPHLTHQTQWLEPSSKEQHVTDEPSELLDFLDNFPPNIVIQVNVAPSTVEPIGKLDGNFSY